MQDKERFFAFVPGVARNTATVEKAMSCYVPEIIPINTVPRPHLQAQFDRLRQNKTFVIVKESRLLIESQRLKDTKKRRHAEDIKEGNSTMFSTHSPSFFEVNLKSDKTFCEDEGKPCAQLNADEVDFPGESVVILYGFQRRI